MHVSSRELVMEIRNIGRSGLRVSSIGLGCNNFGGRIDLEATRTSLGTAGPGSVLAEKARVAAGAL